MLFQGSNSAFRNDLQKVFEDIDGLKKFRQKTDTQLEVLEREINRLEEDPIADLTNHVRRFENQIAEIQISNVRKRKNLNIFGDCPICVVANRFAVVRFLNSRYFYRIKSPRARTRIRSRRPRNSRTWPRKSRRSKVKSTSSNKPSST